MPSLGPVVRVALAERATRLEISCESAWRVAFEGRSRAPLDAPAGATWIFEADRSSGGARVRVTNEADAVLGAFEGTLVAYAESTGAFLRTHARPYRGYFVLTAGNDGLLLVNRLRLEDYVPSVVGNEIGKSGKDLLEAFKAQAVAARTYALLRSQKRAGQPFDVTDDHMDQVYTGLVGESEAVLAATRATAGEIITAHGEPVEAVYSSTCGGRTATRSEVWGEDDEGHLRSKKDRERGEDLCKASPLYRWSFTWKADEFRRIVAANGPAARRNGAFPDGPIESVKVKGRTSSGRVRTLEIETKGGRFSIERDAIRWALRQPKEGTPPLPSSAFDIKVRKEHGQIVSITAEGRGYGHGVGMCQFGAMALSREGRSYEHILRHYYHGIKIRRVY